MNNVTTICFLIIPCIITAAFIFHRTRLKRLYHQKKEFESKALEFEALLYHSKQSLTKLNHEIRNPLNGVMGLTTLLQETPLSVEQRGYVDSIHDCSANVIKALNQTVRSQKVEEQEKIVLKPDNAGWHSPSAKLSSEFAKLYPMQILIAEDDEMNQQLTSMILKKLGYSPQIAPNGKEVLETVSDKKYDLILMDVQMPEMNGLDATRMIRLCLRSQPVIIAMTANAMDGDKEACLTAGMDDYISKPVNINELVEKLEKWALTLTHVQENT